MVDNLDRHLRRDLKFYQKQIPCKVGMIQDSLSVDVLRAETMTETNPIEHKSFYYITKPILSVASQVGEITEQSDISNGTESLTNDAIKGSAMLRSNMTTSDLQTCFLSEKTGNILLFLIICLLKHMYNL